MHPGVVLQHGASASPSGNGGMDSNIAAIGAGLPGSISAACSAEVGQAARVGPVRSRLAIVKKGRHGISHAPLNSRLDQRRKEKNRLSVNFMTMRLNENQPRALRRRLVARPNIAKPANAKEVGSGTPFTTWDVINIVPVQLSWNELTFVQFALVIPDNW